MIFKKKKTVLEEQGLTGIQLHCHHMTTAIFQQNPGPTDIKT